MNPKGYADGYATHLRGDERVEGQIESHPAVLIWINGFAQMEAGALANILCKHAQRFRCHTDARTKRRLRFILPAPVSPECIQIELGRARKDFGQ